MQQERISQQQIEFVVEVPTPMTQEEIVHVPNIINQHRHHHGELEQIVDGHVPIEQEESIHLPKIIQQQRLIRQACRLAGSSAGVSHDPVPGLMIVEVPVPMIQKGI
eukprot:355629-Heterocapsa_arctica.AAC.1